MILNKDILNKFNQIKQIFKKNKISKEINPKVIIWKVLYKIEKYFKNNKMY